VLLFIILPDECAIIPLHVFIVSILKLGVNLFILFIFKCTDKSVLFIV